MWWEGLPIYVLAGLVGLELLFYAFFGATVWRIVGRRRQEEPKPREEE
tara:strand:+ start:135 stop:278 length:144 start_codon:yes stop_codon:yes gene_type:complete